VRLWLHDGLADFDSADDIKGMDTWQTTDKIREAYGDEMIQMLCIGPAGENKSPVAQVSENYWGSKDCFNLGAVFGEKNVKAVAMRGLGALEVAEGFFQKCMDLKNDIVNGAVAGKAGIADIAADLGIDVEGMKKSIHRNNAAYNCPYPYYTFLKYREAPDAMAMDGTPEPGCLVSDLAGYAQLQKAGLDAAEAIEKCYRLGLDPAAAAAAGVSDISALDGLAESGAQAPDVSQRWPIDGSPEADIAGITQAFSTVVPPRGLFANKSEGAQWWADRQALAYTLGLDPVIALMTPEITDDRVAELVQMCAEWDEFSADELKRITGELVQKGS
jgi:aldehyde:ferredoxin oxidoreductase